MGRGYTHFLIGKTDNKIVDGWDYKGLDTDEIKHWVKIDMKENDFYGKTKNDFKLVTSQYLIKNGINSKHSNNWDKSRYDQPTNTDETPNQNAAEDQQLDELSPQLKKRAFDTAKITGRGEQAKTINTSIEFLKTRDEKDAKELEAKENKDKWGAFYELAISFYKLFNYTSGEIVLDRIRYIDNIRIKNSDLVIKCGESTIEYDSYRDELTIYNHLYLDRKGAVIILKIIKQFKPETKISIQKGMGNIVGIHLPLPAPEPVTIQNESRAWGGPANVPSKDVIGSGYGGTLNEQLNKLKSMNSKLNGTTFNENKNTMSESMYDSKGNFYGGPNPDHEYGDDDQEYSFVTKSPLGEGTVTVFYTYDVRPSGIRKEQRLSGVAVTRVLDNQSGETLGEEYNEEFSGEAYKKAQFEVDAGNESLYGI